ncbi:MAG: cation:proton antiporter [Pirellulaceae bacterium]|nr:cation:proton antiporter [Pirellulaceae bacterium]
MQEQVRRPADHSRFHHVLGYLLMVGVGMGIFVVIRSIGEALAVQSTTTTLQNTDTVAAPPTAHVLPHVLGALLAVIVLGRTFGWMLVKIGQPPVIGEMLAGIALGPSVLGKLSHEAMQFIMPASIEPMLGIIAQLGVILYMFLVGLELNPGAFKSKAYSTIAISHASILVPFLLGSGLALQLYEPLAPAGVSFTSFALFVGVAMAITAFPVLARILSDRRMEKSDLGVIAISCAAAADVSAWCLLALVTGISQSDLSGAIRTSLLAISYIGLVLVLAQRFGGRIASIASRGASTKTTVWILISVLVSTLITESIGIHAIFGAFLVGAVIPHDSVISSEYRAKLHDFVTILLLPAFFAVTGMRTEIGLLSNAADWLTCGVIIIVATLGKFGGTVCAAKYYGLDWWSAASLGALMNTRGLMELVVLSVGLDLGIISQSLFTMMVIMALVTTVTTVPAMRIIEWLQARRPGNPDMVAT